jgi:hypothetical protein
MQSNKPRDPETNQSLQSLNPQLKLPMPHIIELEDDKADDTIQEIEIEIASGRQQEETKLPTVQESKIPTAREEPYQEVTIGDTDAISTPKEEKRAKVCCAQLTISFRFLPKKNNIISRPNVIDDFHNANFHCCQSVCMRVCFSAFNPGLQA